MKSILEEMYNGTLRPFSEVHTHSAEREKFAEKHLTAEQNFLEQYPECREAFEKLLAEYAEFESYIACEQFQLGFRAGAQMMMEMLRPIE